jgi:hypothetical protein
LPDTLGLLGGSSWALSLGIVLERFRFSNIVSYASWDCTMIPPRVFDLLRFGVCRWLDLLIVVGVGAKFLLVIGRFFEFDLEIPTICFREECYLSGDCLVSLSASYLGHFALGILALLGLLGPSRRGRIATRFQCFCSSFKIPLI